MSQDTEEKDGKGVADIDISPHEETNLLKRIRAGELIVSPRMMGFGVLSTTTPKPPSTSSQGGLSLQELRERSAARQAKEAQENAENKEARELKDFLKLGEKIHKEKCPPNPFLSGNGLGALTTSLGKSVSNDPEDIWSAICCLESYYSNILSLQFQFELPRGKQKPVYYSSRNLSKALTELKRSLKALAAFKERQLSGDDTSSPAKAEKEEQINFILKGRPFTDCFKLVGLPRSQDNAFHLIRWEKPPVPAVRYEFNLRKEGDVAMSTLPGITGFLSYSVVLKLREKNIHTTADLLRLSSRQFKNFKFDPRTVRAIVEKMLHARYFFSDGRTATEEVLSQPAPGERKKLKGITALLQNQSLVNKLRAKGIRETEQLVKLTSAQLIDLIPVNEGNNFLSVRAIAKKLDKHGLHLADKDGPKATRHLFDYHPETYKPLLEAPEPSATPPPDSAAADPASSVSAAADPATSEASVTDPDPNSLETVLREIGRAFDMLKGKFPTLSQLTISANFKNTKGKGHRISINEMNLSPTE